MAIGKLPRTRYLGAAMAALLLPALLLPEPISAAEPKEKASASKAPSSKPPASKLVEKIGELGSNSAAAFYYISGMSLLRSGKFPQALNEFNKACEFCPANPVCLEGRAMCYLSMDKYQKCIDDLNKAIKSGDANASCYKTRGRAFYELKDYSKCNADLSEAIRKDPNDSKTYLLRAFSYVANNEVEKVTAHAIHGKPNSSPVKATPSHVSSKETRVSTAPADTQPKPSVQVPDVTVIPDSTVVSDPTAGSVPLQIQREPVKPIPAHAVETFSGGALTIKTFDKDGNPNPQE